MASEQKYINTEEIPVVKVPDNTIDAYLESFLNEGQKNDMYKFTLVTGVTYFVPTESREYSETSSNSSSTGTSGTSGKPLFLENGIIDISEVIRPKQIIDLPVHLEGNKEKEELKEVMEEENKKAENYKDEH